MSNDKITQPQEDKVEEQVQENEIAEETMEEILGKSEEETVETEVETEEKAKPKKPESVPIHVFEAIKNELKEEIRELKKSQGNSTPSDSSIADLTKKYNVDSDFVGELAQIIQSSTMKDFESKYSKKISDIENLTKGEIRDKKFDLAFAKTIEAYPYFKDVANKEIIKQLVSNPSNGKKTLSQIMEEVYGHTVKGSKTMETAQPSGNREETVDFSKAGDPATYARIKADPKLRKEYNEYVLKNLNI